MFNKTTKTHVSRMIYSYVNKMTKTHVSRIIYSYVNKMTKTHFSRIIYSYVEVSQLIAISVQYYEYINKLNLESAITPYVQNQWIVFTWTFERTVRFDYLSISSSICIHAWPNDNRKRFSSLIMRTVAIWSGETTICKPSAISTVYICD